MFRKFVILRLLTAIGCSKPVPSSLVQASAPTLAPGWVHHETSGSLSLAAPDHWILSKSHVGQVGINTQNLERSLNSAVQSSASEEQIAPPTQAKVTDAVDSEDLENQRGNGEVLLLYDSSIKPIPGEVMTRLVVRKEPASGTLEEIINTLRDNLRPVKLPIGPAAMSTNDDTTRGGDVITDVRYIVVDGSDLYTFLFETSNHEGNVNQEADPIMQTVRLKQTTSKD